MAAFSCTRDMYVPKVESSLLQIDPALCWNFSQTILNFSGKSYTHELGQFEVKLTQLLCFISIYDFIKFLLLHTKKKLYFFRMQFLEIFASIFIYNNKLIYSLFLREIAQLG